ncbi:hypothetical protein ACFX2K_041970 [Malus domestica]
MGIPDEERANHQNIDQHETSLKPDVSTQSRRSGGRHLIARGLEGSKAIYRDCRDFLKQRRDNPLHICSKINYPRVSERLGPLPRPRPAANLGNERQTDHLHSADDLYTIRQKPDESLREYAGHFSHEYSCCDETDDKTALKAFTAGLRDCFFKYMINANTWKTYFKVMAQAYNHASAEARTYQGNPYMVNPYQQVESGGQVLPSDKILAIQILIASSHASFSYSLSHQTYLSLGKNKDFYSQQAHYNKRDKSLYQDNQR